MSLPVKERAFVIASIDARCAAERKKEAELKNKARSLMSDTGRELFPRW